MKFLNKIKNNRLVLGTTLALMSAPSWAYKVGDDSDDSHRGAFNNVAQALLDVLGGSGGLVVIFLSVAGAAFGMVSGNTKLVWIMVGVCLLLGVAPMAVQNFFGAVF